MSGLKQTVTGSEYEIMKVLWGEQKQYTVGEVCSALSDKKKWKSTTVATLLTRLVEKGAVSFEKKGKTHYYYAVLQKEDYSIRETKSFLSKLYNGSVKNLVASLYENKEISKEEIDDLRKMFDLEQSDD